MIWYRRSWRITWRKLGIGKSHYFLCFEYSLIVHAFGLLFSESCHTRSGWRTALSCLYWWQMSWFYAARMEVCTLLTHLNPQSGQNIFKIVQNRQIFWECHLYFIETSATSASVRGSCTTSTTKILWMSAKDLAGRLQTTRIYGLEKRRPYKRVTRGFLRDCP